MTEPADLDLIDGQQLKLVALDHAVDLHRATYKPGDERDRGDEGVLRTAAAYHRWLNRPDPGTAVIVFDQQVTRTGDNTVQIKIDATSPLTGRVVLRDSRGNTIPDDPSTDLDNVRFTLSAEGPLVLNINPDGRNFALDIVELGDTVLTAEVDTSVGVRTVTEALQVIPGDVATMALEFDAPVQPV